jgi:hypothetical protein
MHLQLPLGISAILSHIPVYLMTFYRLQGLSSAMSSEKIVSDF